MTMKLYTVKVDVNSGTTGEVGSLQPTHHRTICHPVCMRLHSILELKDCVEIK